MSLSGLPFRVPPEYAGLIEIASQRWGIPDSVLASQLWAESRFDPNATSPAGAEGIAQFEPGTAADNGVNPWDPSSAIDGMARLDSQYLSQFGSMDLALAAYNAGPGSVQKAGNQVPNIPETQSYVTTILADAGVSGSTGPQSAGTSTSSGSTLGAIGAIFEHADDPEFWKRIGKGGLAVLIVGGGLFMLVKKEPGTMKPLRELTNIP